jgi:3-oxocholest-4-en-26-oyl-CoA dehydrogenase beta subunit
VKVLVPSGLQADRILVPARGADGTIALGWFAPDGQGIAASAQTGSDGLAAAGLVLERALPIARLDRDGNGAEILAWLMERAVIARCMMQVGVTERALEMTSEYGRERVQFDRPIGSFQAFHQRAADAYIHVESMRLTAWEAAWRLSEGLFSTSQVAVAKYCAAEGGAFASFACQHLHGGIGIDIEYPLHRYFKWAIQIEHEFGSARHQLAKLGRDIAVNGVPVTA